MTKNDPDTRRGPGRPRKGNVMGTFKLAPRIAAALQKATEMTEKGKNQLVQAAIIAYLH